MTDILTYRRHRFDALYALLTGEGMGTRPHRPHTEGRLRPSTFAPAAFVFKYRT